MDYYQKRKTNHIIFGLLLLIATVFLMTGCHSEPKEMKFEEEDLEARLEYLLYTISQSTEGQSAELFQSLDKEELEPIFQQSGEPVTAEAFLSGIDGYLQIRDETGSLEKIESIDLVPDGKELHATVVCKFEKRNVKINAVFNKKGIITVLSYSPEYSLGEIAKKAGMNTMIGMGTVFVILAFIAFVISLFKYLPNVEAGKEKEAQTETKKEVFEVLPEENLANDRVLVAIITAAIAEYEKLPDEKGFVVKRIARRKDNRW